MSEQTNQQEREKKKKEGKWNLRVASRKPSKLVKFTCGLVLFSQGLCTNCDCRVARTSQVSKIFYQKLLHCFSNMEHFIKEMENEASSLRWLFFFGTLKNKLYTIQYWIWVFLWNIQNRDPTDKVDPKDTRCVLQIYCDSHLLKIACICARLS